MLVPFRGNGLSFGNPNFRFGDPITSSKGVGQFVIRLNGESVTLNGYSLTVGARNA